MNSVHTLKTLIETYLSQNPKPMPNLQEEAAQMAKEVLQQAGALPDSGETETENAKTSGEVTPSTTLSQLHPQTDSPVTIAAIEGKEVEVGPYQAPNGAENNVTVVHPGNG